MIDIVITTGNMTSCNARLKQLGIVVRDPEDEEGNKRKIEDTYEIVNTPILEDVTGDFFFTIRLSAEQYELIPPSGNTPNFDIIWDSTEYDETDPENPVLFPWPEAEVQAYDIDGLPDGTRMQGVGRIA
jgi:hypothetical protein